MALMWLLPRVGAHVRSQGGRPGVHFITQATLVRLGLTGWSYDRELEKSPLERPPPNRNPGDTRSRFGYLSHLSGTLRYQLERKIHSLVDD